MLALVTCHIFPPSIWYGKKWIPVTWLPWESARIFSDATASQMHSPAMRNPAFTSKSAMSQIRGEPHDFLKLLPLHASKNILHHNLHYPSSWLKMVQDYLCHYVNLVTTDRNSGKCATLLHGQMYLQEKTPVLQFGHTLEQNSSICPSISYLWMVDLVMRFFPCGASLWRSSARIRPKKGPAPWILFLTPAPRPLQVTFFGWWSWTCVSVPFCKDNCIFSKKNMCFAIWARVDTKFLNSAHHVLSVDDWPGDATFFLWANLWNHPQVFSQKRSSPLDLIFDPCAFASWSHFFGWWRWTYVVVPLLQSHLKNHTHSINHGTFFPGVWHLDMF